MAKLPKGYIVYQGKDIGAPTGFGPELWYYAPEGWDLAEPFDHSYPTRNKAIVACRAYDLSLEINHKPDYEII